MSDKKKELPAELVKFRDSYVEMFGSLPPLPAARFEFSGEVNPEFLRVAEQMRGKAFYNDVRHEDHAAHPVRHAAGRAQPVGAQAHAAAARSAGASWEELHTVVQLAAATGALYPQQRRRAAQGCATRSRGLSHEALPDLLRAAIGAVLSLIALSAIAADYPAPKEGDVHRQGLPLPHRRGDAGAEAALHDRSARRPGEPVLVLHGTARLGAAAC